MPAPYDAILLRYDEIALKGGNRMAFENRLVENVHRAIGGLTPISFLRERGRIVVRLHDKTGTENGCSQLLLGRLAEVFGLSSFSPGYLASSDIDAIAAVVNAGFAAQYARVTANTPADRPVTYRMRARRSSKTFPLTSNEIEIRFADRFRQQYPRLVVNLDAAEIDIGVEIRADWSFIYVDRIEGPGGLPCGGNEPALALISGGIDSPVACYLTMKRGCPVHFLTFHSYPYTSQDGVNKTRRIIEILNRLQRPGKFFACNLAPAQKVIRDRCSESYRTVLYRRLMMRVAAVVARQLRIQALITGDAVGQVASQTIGNMSVINQATDMLVLRPLAAMDKRDIMSIARKIGTLSISEESCADSCTVFAPRSPAIRAPLQAILEEEAALSAEDLLGVSVATMRLIDVASGTENEMPRPRQDRTTKP